MLTDERSPEVLDRCLKNAEKLHVTWQEVTAAKALAAALPAPDHHRRKSGVDSDVDDDDEEDDHTKPNAPVSRKKLNE